MQTIFNRHRINVIKIFCFDWDTSLTHPLLQTLTIFSVNWRVQITARTRRWPNVGLLSLQRWKRWARSEPTLRQRLLLAEV